MADEDTYLNDTDMVSLLQHGNQTVAEHVGSHSPEEVATTYQANDAKHRLLDQQLTCDLNRG